jgi:polysaccharide pyruvyl transferase WcaK-like protein
LGDEAILAGYLLDGATRGIDFSVVSISPTVTRESLGAICASILIADESREALGFISHRASVRNARTLVIGGGGYLNRSWTTEIGGKLTRLGRLARRRHTVMHAVEMRGLASSPTERRARQLARGAAVAVRDESSRAGAVALGATEPTIVPDAIALLVPHSAALVTDVPEVRGKVLVNLLDVAARSDAAEAEFPTDNWCERARELAHSVDGEPLGLAIDADDARFILDGVGLPVLMPLTVRGLVAAIGSADQVVTTRMHPGLIASMLGKPTHMLAYCGKVRPTLRRLGLEEHVLPPGNLTLAPSGTYDAPATLARWQELYAETASWLYGALDQA